jgi:hypothetical protein
MYIYPFLFPNTKCKFFRDVFRGIFLSHNSCGTLQSEQTNRSTAYIFRYHCEKSPKKSTIFSRRYFAFINFLYLASLWADLCGFQKQMCLVCLNIKGEYFPHVVSAKNKLLFFEYLCRTRLFIWLWTLMYAISLNSLTGNIVGVPAWELVLWFWYLYNALFQNSRVARTSSSLHTYETLHYTAVCCRYGQAVAEMRLPALELHKPHECHGRHWDLLNPFSRTIVTSGLKQVKDWYHRHIRD